MQELKRVILEAGVVGAGGAGFPTHVKFAPNIQTVLINGAECEPLAKTDLYLMREYSKELEEILNFIVEKVGAKNGVIAIKKHTGEELGIEDGRKNNKVSYKHIPDIYPAGDEIILIKEALSLDVPGGNLPISVGVVVLNVETLYNIKNAYEGKGVYEKFLTVGGETGKTYVLKVPVGTPVKHIFDSLDIKIPKGHEVIDGGPMMGNIINPDTAVVTKTTKALLIIDENTLCIKIKKKNLSRAINQASSNCCSCRMCTDLCPRYLMGYPIEPHKIISSVVNKVADTKTFMGAFYCSNCGVCRTVSCPQNLLPSLVFSKVKNELSKHGVRANVMEKTVPSTLREYRKIPVSRVVLRLGIKKYDRRTFEVKDIPISKQITLPLKMHIGASAVSVVKVGDKVKAGQLIAKVPENALGTNLHASVSGVVKVLNENCIIINAD